MLEMNFKDQTFRAHLLKLISQRSLRMVNGWSCALKVKMRSVLRVTRRCKNANKACLFFLFSCHHLLFLLSPHLIKTDLIDFTGITLLLKKPAQKPPERFYV